MIADRFSEFCVVGLGNHARTKVMPALAANGQTIAAVVSRKADYLDFDGAVYRTLEQAVEALPPSTVFFVATPPAVHFEQAKLILGAGFDLFLEKPAFVTSREALAIASLCEAGQVVLIEGMMHRYTRLYAEFVRMWSDSSEKVGRIEIRFLIDRLPAGTFRSEIDVSSSTIFDIGCYPVSLLSDLGLKPVLRLAELRHPHEPERAFMRIDGRAGEIDIDISIGMSSSYENELRMQMKDGRTLIFSPFFYGRPGKRAIGAQVDGRLTIKELDDENGFCAMLRISRSVWQEDQPTRLRRMIGVTRQLEELVTGLGGLPFAT